jgi:hypothetical protein
MNDLLNLYRSHQGKVTDRWLAYLNEYEHLFAAWRERPVRLLEIGIQNGGSLEIWSRYFPQAKVLVGCDIDPLCGRLTYDDPRICVVVGDASTDETAGRINAISAQWDIVIEDGSHQSRHIVDAFARFFPHVVEGGVFVAEDLHCSYWREFEGGLADPFSAISFFKRLADLTNFEHWGVPVSRSDYLAGFAAHYGSVFNEASLAMVASVEFVNSQCVIRKRVAADNELGPRLIVGTVELVSTGARQYDGTHSQALDQRANAWSDPVAYNLAASERIRGLEVNLAQLADTLSARERSLSQLCADKVREDLENGRRAHEYRLQVEALNAEIRERDFQIGSLLAVQSTPSARLARVIDRVAKKLFPAQSLRRLALAHVLVFADRVYRHGLLAALRGLQADRGPGEDGSRIQGVVSADAGAQPPEFAAWIRAYEPDTSELARQRAESAPYEPDAPMFSVIVPVYKIPAAVLIATLESVRSQTWQNWELCVGYADIENEQNWLLLQKIAQEEPRLRIERLAENGGISRNSNASLAIARGEFVALLDHDDELTPWALHDMAQRISQVPDADFLYSDKDSINASGTLRQNPLFKPQWSPEMLYSANYLTHLNVMRRVIIEQVGGWNPDTDGAQDWDIFFRVAEKSRSIERVPGIHYHWRIIAGSTATGIGAKPYAALGQLRTLEMRLRRLGLEASVVPSADSGYRLAWHLAGRPELDVVLHGEAADADIAATLRSLGDQCDGLLASVTVAWTDDGEPAGFPACLPGGMPVNVVRTAPGDKLGAIAKAVSMGQAPAVLLLDFAVTRLANRSLQDLAGWVLKHPDIGFATALVQLGDDTVVEAGRVVGQGGCTQPLFRGAPLRHWGPLGGPLWYRNVSAAGDTAIAFKRDRLQLQGRASAIWAEVLAGICADALGSDRRGLVSPHARAFVARMPVMTGTWHESMRADPFFHPAFRSVVPLAFDQGKR